MINSRSELRIVESQSSAVCPRWRRSFNVSSSSKNYRHVKLICNNFSRSTYCQWVTKKTTLVILRRSIRVEHPPTPPPLLGYAPGILIFEDWLVRIPAPGPKLRSSAIPKCGKGDSWSSLVWSTNNVKLSKVKSCISFCHCRQLFLLQALFHAVKSLWY